jgi:hypothetical protein
MDQTIWHVAANYSNTEVLGEVLERGKNGT